MRWSEGRGAGDGWEGQRGEELLPRSGQQLAPESIERAGENTNDAPPPPQVVHFFGEWGGGGVEGGRKGGVNKRPQLLTVLLVFRSPPSTRSKEASAGGVTGEGRRGWEEEG